MLLSQSAKLEHWDIAKLIVACLSQVICSALCTLLVLQIEESTGVAKCVSFTLLSDDHKPPQVLLISYCCRVSSVIMVTIVLYQSVRLQHFQDGSLSSKDTTSCAASIEQTRAMFTRYLSVCSCSI